MCTAATYRSQDFYFGRTFDYEFNYGEEVVVTPRNYSFQLRHQNALTEHYAMIGIAHMVGDYPLYYDADNPPPYERYRSYGGGLSAVL